MEGVTQGAWLEVLTKHQWVPAWWTPFIRISTGVPRLSVLRAKLAPFLQCGLPVIAQIMGTDTVRLAETARRLFTAGAAVVDLNCACPSHTVIGNHAGGYCLRHPEWIGETLSAMRAACGNKPLSVKLRSGWESPQEFEKIAAVLRAVSPDFVTVHFRTVAEEYRAVPDGLARLSRIRELLPEITLLGSGDLFSAEEIRRMSEECGVDGVAVARGMLRRPWLLAEAMGHAVACGPEQLLSEFASAPKGFRLQLAASFFGRESDAFHRYLNQI